MSFAAKAVIEPQVLGITKHGSYKGLILADKRADLALLTSRSAVVIKIAEVLFYPEDMQNPAVSKPNKR
ncbi:hypothetical protein TU84_01945 [Pseudomonas helleri]|nr:hypothetical protein TU84_01945 [Pseudomonas helleri]